MPFRVKVDNKVTEIILFIKEYETNTVNIKLSFIDILSKFAP